MGSIWGNLLKISIFGESHGKVIGTVIDGFPAGFNVNMDYILFEMARRAPGNMYLTTERQEEDYPIILSGVLNGVTTGAPICVMINNKDTHSVDYERLRDVPRPSHSDYTGGIRYNGNNDIRGGGHFSGRLTAPLVFAGALCKDFLRKRNNIEIGSHLFSVGEVLDSPFELESVDSSILQNLQSMKIPVINETLSLRMRKILEEAKNDGDSIGGVVECAVIGAKAGIGNPIFENVESRMASILYAIPGVKGVEFGLGFDMSKKRGTEVNDCLVMDDGMIKTKSNNSGGISGGITTGMPIVLKVAFKPTASIGSSQITLNLKTGNAQELNIQGRHDPCIALRSPVIVEAAVAVAMMDLHLEAFGYDAR